jgi:hypothetical protein
VGHPASVERPTHRIKQGRDEWGTKLWRDEEMKDDDVG